MNYDEYLILEKISDGDLKFIKNTSESSLQSLKNRGYLEYNYGVWGLTDLGLTKLDYLNE